LTSTLKLAVSTPLAKLTVPEGRPPLLPRLSVLVKSAVLVGLAPTASTRQRRVAAPE
jgi:hypothetical protein